MNIMQAGRSDGAAVTADRLVAIHEIVREMFDVDEILQKKATETTAAQR
jgi:hypothetical protein